MLQKQRNSIIELEFYILIAKVV